VSNSFTARACRESHLALFCFWVTAATSTIAETNVANHILGKWDMASLPGIYLAVVVNANDPEGRHRIQVSFPSGVATGQPWARPCRPPGAHALPKVGAQVWIAFEAGYSDHPVWIGVADDPLHG